MRLAEDSWNLGEQGFAFDVAVSAEARGDAIEVGIVIAGVAAEFVGAGGWQRGENLSQSAGSELAGGGDGDCAVGGLHAGVADLGQGGEARAEAADEVDGEAARGVAVMERRVPGRLKWIANGADGCAVGDL